MNALMSFCVRPQAIRFGVDHNRQHDNLECPVAVTLHKMYPEAISVKVYSNRVEIRFASCVVSYVDADGSLSAFTRVFDNDERERLTSWLVSGCPIHLRKQMV